MVLDFLGTDECIFILLAMYKCFLSHVYTISIWLDGRGLVISDLRGFELDQQLQAATIVTAVKYSEVKVFERPH